MAPKIQATSNHLPCLIEVLRRLGAKVLVLQPGMLAFDLPVALRVIGACADVSDAAEGHKRFEVFGD